MVDTSMRDYRNAEANIKGALKDKKGKDEMNNQYLHSMNIGTYNRYGLHTVITVLIITITLFLVVFASDYFLLILPLIYVMDRFFANKRKIAIVEMREKLLKASEESKDTDPYSVFAN